MIKWNVRTVMPPAIQLRSNIEQTQVHPSRVLLSNMKLKI